MKLHLYKYKGDLVFGSLDTNGEINLYNWDKSISTVLGSDVTLASSKAVTLDIVTRLIAFSVKKHTTFTDALTQLILAKKSVNEIAANLTVGVCTVRSLVQLFDLHDLWKVENTGKRKQSF